MIKISVFLICKNEERIIEKTLAQASKIADEIVIVDSGSEDKTLEIASRFTNKIFYQEWLGFSKQKAYAMSLCSQEWVLNLDADEVLSDELIDEIKKLRVDDLEKKEVNGCKIARKLFIGKRFIKWGGYYPDFQLRLFKKAMVHYPEKAVHESAEFIKKSKYLKLKNPINHFAYGNIEDMKKNLFHYAKLFNEDSLNLNKLGDFKALLKGIYIFIYKYFIRLGFLDGLTGYKLAQLQFKYAVKKYKK